MFGKEIEQADLQRREIDERLQRLYSDLRRTEEAIRRGEAELNQLTGYINGLEKISHSGDPNHGTVDELTTRVVNPSRVEVADAALAIIRVAGHPLGRAELFRAVQERGLTITGKDPAMVFSTMLWREQKRVARLRGFGYWPADEAYAPAGYTPGGEEPTLF